tara:strand:- start:8199 stop:8561 length:363 start_codon:yes stop_codon:yes gene_type:complete
MAVNYTSLQKTALNLLEANGQAITFSYTTGEDIDPATGVVSDAGSTITVTGFGAATRYRNIEIDGEAIQASDMRLICDNVSTKPEQGWNIYVNSGNWRVMDVQEISPAGINVIYICQLRK